MNWQPIHTCPLHDGIPFLVLRFGNEAHHFLVQQVQAFEGNLYPDALGFAVDYGDAIHDAAFWCDIESVPMMVTQDAAYMRIDQ